MKLLIDRYKYFERKKKNVRLINRYKSSDIYIYIYIFLVQYRRKMNCKIGNMILITTKNNKNEY